MVFGLAGLGEQTLNRIAEMAIASQLDAVDQLKVQVKTDLELLAQGRLASLHIDGQGLIMQHDLRLQRMQIEINDIAVDPWKALGGKIQLLEAATGKARLVLTEADVNRAFNSSLLPQMQRLSLPFDEQLMTLTVQQVTCQFCETGTIAINAQVRLHEQNQVVPVAFTTIPTIAAEGKAIALTDVTYTTSEERSPELTAALISQASDILDLRNLEVSGIEFQLRQLQIDSGRLIVQAIAQITQFPTV